MTRLRARASAVLAVVTALAVLGTGPAAASTAGEPGSGPTIPEPRGIVRLARGPTSTDTFYDVPRGHWARSAIEYVAGSRDWMRDFGRRDGRIVFKPDVLEQRRWLARALVRAFAPAELVDPSIEFSDLAPEDPFYPFANVSVKLGWISPSKGRFLPEAPVTTTLVHRALVLALDLRDEAAGLDALHLANGVAIDTPRNFGTLVIGMRLGLRFNHSEESSDVGPRTRLSRSEVAWSLYRAATASQWAKDAMAPYRDITLPKLGPERRRIVEFGVRYAGYPYVWGGEWHRATTAGYCCGAQPVGGFDCSGLVWWAVKAAGGGWSNVPPRAYAGWALPQRTSRDMASVGRKLSFQRKRPGDLLFYDGDADGVVDHVNVYIGRGWALDSSSGYAGVTILWVRSGWYRDYFAHARRIIG